MNSLKDGSILEQAYTSPCNSAGHGTFSAWPKGILKAPITLQVCSILAHNEMVYRRLYFKQITIPQSSLNLSSTCVSLHWHTQACRLSARWGTDLQHLSFCTEEHFIAYKVFSDYIPSLLNSALSKVNFFKNLHLAHFYLRTPSPPPKKKPKNKNNQTKKKPIPQMNPKTPGRQSPKYTKQKQTNPQFVLNRWLKVR